MNACKFAQALEQEYDEFHPFFFNNGIFSKKPPPTLPPPLGPLRLIFNFNDLTWHMSNFSFQ